MMLEGTEKRTAGEHICNSGKLGKITLWLGNAAPFDLLPSKATISDFTEVLYSGSSHIKSSFTVHIDSNK